MKLSDFDYNLPKELIAQEPLEKRDSSRLMIINRQSRQVVDKHFYDLYEKLSKNDVLVVNKTRVINARLIGKIYDNQINSRNGLKVEIFLHKQSSNNSWDCLVYPGKKLGIGTKIEFINKDIDSEADKLIGEIIEKSDIGRIVKFNKEGINFLDIIDKVGQVPIPPYIKKELKDKERYQTVFNQISGSVAAPTAGLHFTKELIEKLKNKGVVFEEVLLNVGLGTFKSVETEEIENHSMHKEYIELDKNTAKRLNEYKKQGKRIIAVGTTSVRVLESMSDEYLAIHPGKKETDIFIYPGYTRKFVDSMITNFHLPKSTLLMLVSSFAGKDLVDKAYLEAVKKEYRFFSFGDAMFIE